MYVSLKKISISVILGVQFSDEVIGVSSSSLNGGSEN